MKRKTDPRHIARVAAFKKLFEINLRPKTRIDKNTLAGKIVAKQDDINLLVEKNAPAWPISQIAPVDLAILQVAIYELLFKEKKEPYKVVVDEAVEIAKEFGGEASKGFINGVLGSIIKEATSN
ncbi:MAG TPA: transcription antitermination factor NusB [Candidatus Saccharimonadales bacterium]|nr:transcription antitermination factor NusB [Candidatus Saccharimonadales bacterium]